MASTEILRHRLHSHGLLEAASSDPADAVRWLGAMQAQDYLGTLWSIGLRTRDATEATIERAIADGSIVRTWLMRGTLHFVASEDLRWMVGLLGPRMRVLVNNFARQNRVDLDEPAFAKSNEAIAKALDGGRRLTRDEISQALENAGIAASGPKLSLLLQRAQADGLVCYGPRRGKQVTHVLVDEWLPSSRPKRREDALAELTRRYFRGRAPATVEDFAWWSGMTASEAREALGLVQGEFLSEEIDGRRLVVPASGLTGGSPKGIGRLMWGFDEYVVAYKDRSALFRDGNAGRGKALIGGLLRPVVIVDGQAVGTWRRTLSVSKTSIEVNYFDRVTKVERRLVSEAAHDFGRFIGLPFELAETP